METVVTLIYGPNDLLLSVPFLTSGNISWLESTKGLYPHLSQFLASRWNDWGSTEIWHSLFTSNNIRRLQTRRTIRHNHNYLLTTLRKQVINVYTSLELNIKTSTTKLNIFKFSKYNGLDEKGKH